MYEITLTTTNTYNNPYIDVSVTATFTFSTKIIIVNGFWDGGNTWKIRFTPQDIGTWNYIISSNDTNMNGLTGSFTNNNSYTSFIELNPNNIWGWRTSDDLKPHFWMSDTIWRGLQPNKYTYNQFVDVVNTRSAQGFNHFRGHLNSMDVGYSFYNSTSYTSPNITNMQEIDRRIEYANSKGIIMDLCVGSGSRFPSSMVISSSGTPTRERYLKYLIARYSSYNITWEGLSEYEENTNAVNLINAIGNYIKSNDPYQHPRSTHTLNTNDELRNSSWLDWIMYQSSGENPTTIVSNRSYNKPLINEEYWYEASCSTGSSHDDTTTYQMRKGAYKIILSGGYFATGNVATYTGGSNNYSSCGLNGLQINQMKYLYDFFTKTQFWNLKPNNSLVSTGMFCSASLGTEYVIFMPNGGNTSINLTSASGTLLVEWLNTRTGTYQGQTTVQGGASRTFTAPDTNDWILHIYNNSACPKPVCDYTITLI